MPLPKRISLKFELAEGATVELAALVPVFQRWIQEDAVEGLLIDVADYKHIHEGPGVILVGHEGDYAIDLKDGRPGLRYTLKRESHDSLSAQLQVILRRARLAARQLEAEPSLDGLAFAYQAGLITFHDRLNAPNTPEGFTGYRDEIAAFLAEVYGEAPSLTVAYDDPRELLAVRYSVPVGAALDEAVLGLDAVAS